MVTLMFSSWIKFDTQHSRNAIVMTCVLAGGLIYIIAVNLRWWHTFIPTAQHQVSLVLSPSRVPSIQTCHPLLACHANLWCRSCGPTSISLIRPECKASSAARPSARRLSSKLAVMHESFAGSAGVLTIKKAQLQRVHTLQPAPA